MPIRTQYECNECGAIVIQGKKDPVPDWWSLELDVGHKETDAVFCSQPCGMTQMKRVIAMVDNDVCTVRMSLTRLAR